MEASKVAKSLLATKEKRLSLVLPPDVHKSLKAMAVDNDTTIKDLVIEAYRNYLVPTYGGK